MTVSRGAHQDRFDRPPVPSARALFRFPAALCAEAVRNLYTGWRSAFYGLVSYTVKQSTHEIGIRMALGASGLSVVREFLGRGVRLGAVGAASAWRRHSRS